jgi:hypothetical protein
MVRRAEVGGMRGMSRPQGGEAGDGIGDFSQCSRPCCDRPEGNLCNARAALSLLHCAITRELGVMESGRPPRRREVDVFSLD